MGNAFGDLVPMLSARLAKLGQAVFDDAPGEDRPRAVMGAADFSTWLAPRYYDPIFKLFILSVVRTFGADEDVN